MSNPIILDTFCGGGGAAVGYNRAGFDVVGIDIKPQPHYPFPFILGDALDILARMLQGERFLASDGRRYGLDDFAAIHASPPCQGYSVTKSINGRTDHPLLIDATRELLIWIRKPYVIENVEGAPLINPLMLCGTMFPGLRVYRHRLFECNPPIYFAPMSCNHSFSMPKSKGEYHTLDVQEFITCAGHNFQASSGRRAMQIDWMTRQELSQAIPPAYTEYIGGYLLRAVEAQR